MQKYNYKILNIETQEGFNISLTLGQAEQLMPILNNCGIAIRLEPVPSEEREFIITLKRDIIDQDPESALEKFKYELANGLYDPESIEIQEL